MATDLFTGEAPRTLSGRCGCCGVDHSLALEADVGVTALAAWWAALSAPSPLAIDVERAGGKMLAVLVGIDGDGQDVVLRAVSGDVLGRADVEGCVPSIIRREDTADLERETLAVVSAATVALSSSAVSSAEALQLRAARKAASARLMAAMNDKITLINQRGRRAPLRDVFVGAGIPSGTADCGLPKLLQAANQQRLRIRGVAEAWWGPDLGDRRHGGLAAPCARRCEPIIGYLLCERDVDA